MVYPRYDWATLSDRVSKGCEVEAILFHVGDCVVHQGLECLTEFWDHYCCFISLFDSGLDNQ